MQRNVITFGGFKGINNVLDASDLQPDEGRRIDLVEANDVNICDRFKIHTRNGTTTRATLTNVHSLWSNGNVCLLVDNGSLKRFLPDYSTVTLKTGLDPVARMSYADTKSGRIYMTNSTWIGYLENDTIYELPSPTEQYKSKMPSGKIVCYNNNQLFVSVDKFIFASDPLKYNQYDQRNGFIVMDGPVVLMAPVQDGMYVADGTINFLGGTTHLQFTRREVAYWNAVPNTQADVSLSLVGEGNPGVGVLFCTERGIMLGQNGGQAVNLTNSRYHPMTGFWGVGIVRQQNNYYQYVSTIQS